MLFGRTRPAVNYRDNRYVRGFADNFRLIARQNNKYYKKPKLRAYLLSQWFKI